MNPLIQLKTTAFPPLTALALACLGLLPNARATDTDGALAFGNTADGIGVLTSLMTGAWNSGFGFEALNQDTTGSLNTATGLRALFNNTEGDANTANGMMALFNNITGEQNVAVGAQALVSNIDGFQNVAVGTQSLLSNTSGAANCAFGQWALALNTAGDTSSAFGFAALFRNDLPTGAPGNNAFGFVALGNNVTGQDNAAFGTRALVSNVNGAGNCAFGNSALENNDSSAAGSADGNNAFGVEALSSNVDGSANCAFGAFALIDNVNGSFNNAFGLSALGGNVSGLRNTAIGYLAGEVITGSGNVCIGAQVAGEAGVDDSTYIRNVNTTVQSGGGFDTVTVRLADGRLGHAVSSRRYKEDIKPMDRASEALFALKPVMFRYKKQINPEQGVDYGLIAEDVAKVAPELAVRDREGKISNYRRDALNAMLLNEFLKAHRKMEEQEATIAQLKSRMEALTATVKDQASQIQKVSAQLELSKPASRTVGNK
jgi:trimeric autotransporter adhesin